MYGGGRKAEHFLGELLGGRRDGVVIATKFWMGWATQTYQRPLRNVTRRRRGLAPAPSTDRIDLHY